MNIPAKKLLFSTQTQLNLIGFCLVILLGFLAWQHLRPFTLWSVVPLLFFAYAAFRIIFELTWNRGNVPTLATSFIGRRKIAALLRQHAAQSAATPYTVIDLGSGRGELTSEIARSLPHARVVGIEIARWPVAQAKFMQKWLGPKNISYQCLDFWTVDCSNIDAVVFFLTPNFAERVGEKLRRELKPGGIVISHTFPLRGGWTPTEIAAFHTPFKEVVYVYRKD